MNPSELRAMEREEQRRERVHRRLRRAKRLRRAVWVGAGLLGTLGLLALCLG